MSSTNVATFFNNSDIQPTDIIEIKDVLGDVDEDIPPVSWLIDWFWSIDELLEQSL